MDGCDKTLLDKRFKNIDLRIMGKTIKEFTDLITWQKGHNLVLSIYKITDNFPRKETYSLTGQMRRASISITSNIAEGFGRHSFKEKIQFYYLAQGSLIELKNQLIVAKDVGYLKAISYDSLKDDTDTVHKLLQGLIKKTKTYLKS